MGRITEKIEEVFQNESTFAIQGEIKRAKKNKAKKQGIGFYEFVCSKH